MCIIYFANGSEQCIDCTYSGTKLLSTYPSYKEPYHGKLCLQVTIMWLALLVSGQPQTHSAWLPVTYKGGGFQMVSTWHYRALTFAIFWVSSYIDRTLQCCIVVSKTAAREQKWKLGTCPKNPLPYLTTAGSYIKSRCELDWTRYSLTVHTQWVV